MLVFAAFRPQTSGQGEGKGVTFLLVAAVFVDIPRTQCFCGRISVGLQASKTGVPSAPAPFYVFVFAAPMVGESEARQVRLT